MTTRKQIGSTPSISEQYGMAGEQLPGDGLGEGKPKPTRPLHTIKRVLRGKYTKGRSLIH